MLSQQSGSEFKRMGDETREEPVVKTVSTATKSESGSVTALPLSK